MGLFSSIIHIRERDQAAVTESLVRCVGSSGLFHLGTEELMGIPSEESESGLLYYLSPTLGKWTTIIEAHFAVQEAPSTSSLALNLSADLKTYALSLMVHDDDICFYNLCHEGRDLDGYNSNPQYFEEEKLSDNAILEQLHEPRAFAPLLPDGVSLDALEAILTKGWWQAYLDDALDDDGLPLEEDETGYIFEHERMIDIGNLLHLHGQPTDYPFAAWNGNKSINWPTFLAAKATI